MLWTRWHFVTPFSPFYDFSNPLRCCTCMLLLMFLSVLCVLLVAAAFKMPFRKFNSALILFSFIFTKCFSVPPTQTPTPSHWLRPSAICPQLSHCMALGLVISSDSTRLKSISRCLLIFRCVLFSVKIKLLICAFVCIDLVRFNSPRPNLRVAQLFHHPSLDQKALCVICSFVPLVFRLGERLCFCWPAKLMFV